MVRHWTVPHCLLALLLLATFVGCDFFKAPPQQPSNTSSIATKDRPPLQIVLVDVDFGDDLNLQWQSFSEQPIQIERIRPDEVAARQPDATDVWIYPSQLLGDLVATEKIVSLPQGAMGVPFSGNEEESNSGNEPASNSWPSRWRGASRFGSSIYGLPLGAPQLVFVGRNIAVESLDVLNEEDAPIEDRTTIAREGWRAILESAGNASTPEKSSLSATIKNVTPEQRDAMVDRFLWIASTTNAKRRGLFDITQLQPRLAVDEFVFAAEVFQQLATQFPETMVATHAEAWGKVRSQGAETPAFAIAYPAASGGEGSEVGEMESLKFSKLSFNPFQGLNASIGKKTRQTSVASQFVAWLSAPEQREVLARRSPRIERWPNQFDSQLVNADRRAYHNLNNREQRGESLMLSTRFANSLTYRAVLAECLIKILEQPEQTSVHLEECTRRWNETTESVGLLKQRKNVELSMGLGS